MRKRILQCGGITLKSILLQITTKGGWLLFLTMLLVKNSPVMAQYEEIPFRVLLDPYLLTLQFNDSSTTCSSNIAEGIRAAAEDCMRVYFPTSCYLDPTYIGLANSECNDNYSVLIKGGVVNYAGGTDASVQQCAANAMQSELCLKSFQTYVPSLTSSSYLAAENPPTGVPTMQPFVRRTSAPTRLPTASPTRARTRSPTPLPTVAATPTPTKKPSPKPTPSPTTSPPTSYPTHRITNAPTASPTKSPSRAPTPLPTKAATITSRPTVPPTVSPTTANNDANGNEDSAAAVGQGPVMNQNGKDNTTMIASAASGVAIVVLALIFLSLRRKRHQGTEKHSAPPAPIGEYDDDNNYDAAVFDEENLRSKSFGLQVQDSLSPAQHSGRNDGDGDGDESDADSSSIRIATIIAVAQLQSRKTNEGGGGDDETPPTLDGDDDTLSEAPLLVDPVIVSTEKSDPADFPISPSSSNSTIKRRNPFSAVFKSSSYHSDDKAVPGSGSVISSTSLPGYATDFEQDKDWDPDDNSLSTTEHDNSFQTTAMTDTERLLESFKSRSFEMEIFTAASSGSSPSPTRGTKTPRGYLG